MQSLVSLVPATSYLRDIAELSPLFVILLSGVLGEFLLDRKLSAIKKTSRVLISEDGIEMHERGKVQRLLWSQVEQITWDNDAGRNYDSYMVAQLSGAGKTLRVSEQFFTHAEVNLVFGLAAMKTNGRTFR